jgi:RNA-splicing ligase RtcB
MYQLNEKIVTFLPPEAIEPQAKTQLENISEMPFVFHHVAVMPDCHLGKGATVGSVIATHGAIIPAAVGVDVGCGMVAVRTKFLAKDLPDNLDRLRQGIERRIPLGAGAGNKKLTDTAVERIHELNAVATRTTTKSTKTGATPSAHSVQAITSSRSASTKTTRCGSCFIRAHAASAIDSQPNTSKSRNN